MDQVRYQNEPNNLVHDSTDQNLEKIANGRQICA